MRVSEFVGCEKFPCADVKHAGYIIPGLDVKPDAISIVMISEAAPPNPFEGFLCDIIRRHRETFRRRINL